MTVLSADRISDVRDNDAAFRRVLYRSMLRIRMTEERIAARYHEQQMRCPVHLSIGQEAAAVGACAALLQDDKLVSTHRCHSHYLAKGGDLKAMMAEIYGRESGCCGGRGGSMHLFDDKVGVALSQPIVGSSIALGVGIALAIQQRRQSQVVMICLGDAATEQGVFHESLNFASIKKLPVIFFVENNFFSVYTHLNLRQPDRSIASLATPHRVSSADVDGNDVLDVYNAVEDAVRRARSGQGPSLIVADTYRFREHCGPLIDDDLGYRSVDEVNRWKSVEPLARFRSQLVRDGELNDQVMSAMVQSIQSEIDEAFEFAINAPFPEAATLGDYVYAG